MMVTVGWWDKIVKRQKVVVFEGTKSIWLHLHSNQSDHYQTLSSNNFNIAKFWSV
jgi:2-keto-3-deoxy-galactonokinase